MVAQSAAIAATSAQSPHHEPQRQTAHHTLLTPQQTTTVGHLKLIQNPLQMVMAEEELGLPDPAALPNPTPNILKFERHSIYILKDI